MGACLSRRVDFSSPTDDSNSALIISINGDLHPYSTPIFVSDVLSFETTPDSSSSSCFLCNSDNLYQDELITPLDSKDELDAGQIYFVLPNAKLRNPLTPSELAALAVKASVALNSKTTTASTSTSRSKATIQKTKNKSRISPFVVMETSQINVIVDEEAQNKRFVDKKSLGVSRSGSIRKMQRYSSRKARLAVRSFRLRLSTISEIETSDQFQLY